MTISDVVISQKGHALSISSPPNGQATKQFVLDILEQNQHRGSGVDGLCPFPIPKSSASLFGGIHAFPLVGLNTHKSVGLTCASQTELPCYQLQLILGEISAKGAEAILADFYDVAKSVPVLYKSILHTTCLNVGTSQTSYGGRS